MEFICNCCGNEFTEFDCDYFDPELGWVCCPQCGVEHYEGMDNNIVMMNYDSGFWGL